MMKQRIKNIIVAIAIALTGTMVLVPAFVSADFKQDACQGVKTFNGANGSGCDASAGTKLDGVIKAVIQILSFVVGAAAVIMVIIGGLKYITANGDSGALASARNTIVYALIGLVIVAIAQILVHYVLFKVSK